MSNEIFCCFIFIMGFFNMYTQKEVLLPMTSLKYYQNTSRYKNKLFVSWKWHYLEIIETNIIRIKLKILTFFLSDFNVFVCWQLFACVSSKIVVIPAGNYMFKVNNRNTRTRCEIYSKLTIKTPKQCLASFWCLYC